MFVIRPYVPSGDLAPEPGLDTQDTDQATVWKRGRGIVNSLKPIACSPSTLTPSVRYKAFSRERMLQIYLNTWILVCPKNYILSLHLNSMVFIHWKCYWYQNKIFYGGNVQFLKLKKLYSDGFQLFWGSMSDGDIWDPQQVTSCAVCIPADLPAGSWPV